MEKQRELDFQLATSCSAGDESAWISLIERYETHVRFTVIQTLRRYGARRPDDVIEDLVSRIFLRVVEDDFRRLRTFSGRSTLKTWFRTLSANTTIDFLRKKRERLWVDDENIAVREPATRETPENVAVDRDLITAFTLLLDELNGEDRTFLNLYYLEGHSFERISEAMGRSVPALYARKHRLTNRLRDLADAHGLLADFTWEETA